MPLLLFGSGIKVILLSHVPCDMSWSLVHFVTARHLAVIVSLRLVGQSHVVPEVFLFEHFPTFVTSKLFICVYLHVLGQ